MAKKQKSSKVKLLVLMLVIVALVAGGYFLIKKHNDNKLVVQTGTASSLKLKQEENQLDNQNKASLPAAGQSTNSQNNKPGNSGNATQAAADIFITYAGESGNTVQVSSYVSGVFENGGTCELTLKNGSTSVTRQDTGIENVSYTTCPTFNIDNTGNSVLASGTWSATVSYSSASYQGVSSANSFEVK
jgi:uncharacterized protein (UPF0333 family)